MVVISGSLSANISCTLAMARSRSSAKSSSANWESGIHVKSSSAHCRKLDTREQERPSANRGIVTTPVCDSESVFRASCQPAEDSEHGREQAWRSRNP